MSRTYSPKNHEAGKFSVNSAGTSILSELVETLRLPRANYKKAYLQDQFDPPWEAPSEVAKQMSAQLEESPDLSLVGVYNSVRDLFDGTPEEFVKWVRGWQEWLKNCDGYKAET